MTDEPEDRSPIGRLLLACGFTESGITYRTDAEYEASREGVMLDANGVVLCRFRDEFGDVDAVRYTVPAIRRDALAREIADLGEAARARMAARLARETALDRDWACAVAAALHHLGKDVDWFVRLIPSTGAVAAAQHVIAVVRHHREDLALIRARERVALMHAMMGVMIDVSDDRIEIELPPWGGELPGFAEKHLFEPVADLPAHQPAYMRHDPTKQHKRRKRR